MGDRLGILLRELRGRAGLTQEQLAQRSGLSVRTIRRLESGGSAGHRLTTVQELADALELTAEQRRRLADALAGERPATDDEGAPDPADLADPADPVDPARSADRLTTRPPVPRALAEAAEELAREIRRRWRREEEQRRVHDPFPLLVRWRPAPAELTDRPDNVRRLGPATGTPELSDPSELPELDLSGDLHRVAEVYRRISSGRLLVLGRAGSGKSVLTIRFVLDLLDSPAPADRVPVVFSLGSWDPTALELRDWLAERLLRDHPHLGRRSPGGATLAAALLDADLVLPVLDGFDEIAAGLREEALRALNETSLPLVLTSRREEFAEAVKAANAPLVWAGGIELADLTVDDLAGYLPRTARTGGANWRTVLAELREGRTVAARRLAEVLTTPLMVILARTVYSDEPDRDPAELLDTARFPSERALEEHLLAGFVPAVYRRRAPGPDRGGAGRGRWDTERAQRWLGYLAHHLVRFDRDRQDLAWWQLGESLRYSSRVLAVVLATTFCVTFSSWLLSPLVVGGGIADAVLLGTMVGPVAGLAFGSVYAVTIAYRGGAVFEPSRVRLRLPRGRGSVDRPVRLVRTVALRCADGLLGGVVVGVGYACALSLERAIYFGVPLDRPALLEGTKVNMLVFGLVFGLAGALVLGAAAALEAPVDVSCAATPTSLLASNRATVGRQVLVLAPLLALTIAGTGRVAVELLQGTLGQLSWGLWDGLFIGAVAGLGGAASYAFAFTAWGQWVLLSRIWLPLTGNLPWDTVAFLDDAYRRGVLRRTGAVYQFRHARLQHHLAGRLDRAA
ncbi:helix-turn-helix domain-containing protein [Kitasatospora viridis]|uniref:NACHT domain-containing protein n=1 Tax=Kitasatospora viridis TaxID=281105 RepID=A0A561S9F1_9ACTN|nr:helix-turn-helix transcriptional regulator [Kitasatospora viridis]TWF71493.1 NACHT domain-containing protein [Kitasatospora viridis]